MGKKKKIKVSAKSVPAGAAKSKKKKTFGKEYWYCFLF